MCWFRNIKNKLFYFLLMQAGNDCKGNWLWQKDANYKLGYSHFHKPWPWHESTCALRFSDDFSSCIIHLCSFNLMLFLAGKSVLLCGAAVSSRQQRRFQHHTGVDQNKRRRLLQQESCAPGRSKKATNTTKKHYEAHFSHMHESFPI